MLVVHIFTNRLANLFFPWLYYSHCVGRIVAIKKYDNDTLSKNIIWYKARYKLFDNFHHTYRALLSWARALNSAFSSRKEDRL